MKPIHKATEKNSSMTLVLDAHSEPKFFGSINGLEINGSIGECMELTETFAHAPLAKLQPLTTTGNSLQDKIEQKWAEGDDVPSSC